MGGETGKDGRGREREGGNGRRGGKERTVVGGRGKEGRESIHQHTHTYTH